MQKTIDLVELEYILPSPTNPRKYFNEARLLDLSKSIVKVGVIQAVTLREYPGKPGMFEIVCGERRYRASKLAALKTIPAEIRKLTDDEVQELQFIENIEREDVHPMDEAVTFKAMQENKHRAWLLEDIAAKINKPVPYVVQRIQLNKLIPALQKHFWDEKFLIGHAILFARLTEADQKECIKKDYGTVKETADYIERNVMRQLSTAPFKMEDNTLVVKCGAGACISCFKRSGVNKLLFDDIKQADRCFDKSCFAEKKEAWLIREVKEVLENKPEIILVEYGYSGAKVHPEIMKLSKQYQVRIMNYNGNDIQTYSSSGYTSFKALWVSGDDAGQYKTVYRRLAAKAAVAAKVAAGGKVTAADIDAQIAGIEERQGRAVELDAAKVWSVISEKVTSSLDAFKINLTTPKILQAERQAIAYALMDSIEYDKRKEAGLLLGIKETFYNGIGEAKKFPEINDTQLFHLLRLFAISKLNKGISHLESGGPAILMPLLKVYNNDLIGAAENEQNAIAKKRIDRAFERVEALREQKKLLKPQKEPAVKVKAEKPGKLAKGIKALLEQPIEQTA